MRHETAQALRRDDIARAITVVSVVDLDLVLREGDEYRRLVASIPGQEWQAHPAIALRMAASFRPPDARNASSALGYLRLAEQELQRSGRAESPDMVRLWLARVRAYRSMGQLEATTEWLDRARVLSEQIAPDRLDVEAERVLERGLLDVHLGRFAHASEHLRFVDGLRWELPTVWQSVECAGALAIVAYDRLELDEADRLADQAEHAAAEAGIAGSPAMAPATVARVLSAWERDDLEAAAAFEPVALGVSKGTMWEPFALAASGVFRVFAGDMATAMDRVAEIQKVTRGWTPKGFGAHIGSLVEATALVGFGQNERAWETLSTAPAGPAHELCPARFIARLRKSHGDLVGAAEVLEDCDRLGGDHSPRTLLDVRMVRSGIQLQTGAMEESDATFDLVLATMARTGSRIALRAVQPGTLVELARRATHRRHGDVARGILDGILASGVEGGPRVHPLTEGERRILAAIGAGLTGPQIAAALYLSPNTVKTHTRNLYRKLGVGSRLHAARVARALGLNHPPSRPGAENAEAEHRSTTDAPLREWIT